MKQYNLPAGRLYCLNKVLLPAEQQEDRRAQGKEAREPGHGGCGRNEGGQAYQQEIDDHTPGGKTFGQTHFASPYQILPLAELPTLRDTTQPEFTGYAENYPAELVRMRTRLCVTYSVE